MMMFLYAVSVMVAVMVCGWAFELINKDLGLSYSGMASFVVAAAGFAVFPIINVATTIILAIMCYEAQQKGRAKK